ncbi:MAG: FecR domain-containing protein, partial [Reyranella sp.]|nr:FecR domain-containing protein [Reyranella sp.]
MGQQFRRGVATVAIGIVSTVLICSSAWAQTEPPGRVGRLAFTNGTVSFHDNQQSSWIPAAVNTPITSGNALWTEPNARSEVSLAGTRIRMEGGTELDVLALDDSQTRLQLPQGRIDVKSVAMDANQPYEIATPRGTIKLLQQGDYYVEAGSTEDPTRLGVRAGAAQIQGLNGKVLAVRPNEVAEVIGDGSTLQ